MIYTASYFEPHRHHGKRLSISRSISTGFQVEGHLEYLISVSVMNYSRSFYGHV